MRTSWRRQPMKGNTRTSWKEAYRVQATPDKTGFTTECLYEDVSAGIGETPEEAKLDFLDNIRSRVTELTEMLEYCALNQPKQIK